MAWQDPVRPGREGVTDAVDPAHGLVLRVLICTGVKRGILFMIPEIVAHFSTPGVPAPLPIGAFGPYEPVERASRGREGRLVLDPRFDNVFAHRFYYRQGLLARALRFSRDLAPDADPCESPPQFVEPLARARDHRADRRAPPRRAKRRARSRRRSAAAPRDHALRGDPVTDPGRGCALCSVRTDDRRIGGCRCRRHRHADKQLHRAIGVEGVDRPHHAHPPHLPLDPDGKIGMLRDRLVVVSAHGSYCGDAPPKQPDFLTPDLSGDRHRDIGLPVSRRAFPRTRGGRPCARPRRRVDQKDLLLVLQQN